VDLDPVVLLVADTEADTEAVAAAEFPDARELAAGANPVEKDADTAEAMAVENAAMEAMEAMVVIKVVMEVVMAAVEAAVEAAAIVEAMVAVIASQRAAITTNTTHTTEESTTAVDPTSASVLKSEGDSETASMSKTAMFATNAQKLLSLQRPAALRRTTPASEEMSAKILTRSESMPTRILRMSRDVATRKNQPMPVTDVVLLEPVVSVVKLAAVLAVEQNKSDLIINKLFFNIA